MLLLLNDRQVEADTSEGQSASSAMTATTHRRMDSSPTLRTPPGGLIMPVWDMDKAIDNTSQTSDNAANLAAGLST
jgi:hypothetical protein